MHLEQPTNSTIGGWQSGQDEESQQKLMDRYPSKRLRVQENAEVAVSRVPGGKGAPGVNTIVPGNPLTIASLRKGQNLASSKLPFLWKLHEMLADVERTGDDHIVSWLDHGKGFRVHRPKSFVQKIIPYYFKQSKYKSFQRQLHLYEFTRTSRGPEAGSYGHPNFVRGVKALCLSMSPKKIKGKGNQKAAEAKNNSKVQTQASAVPRTVSSNPTPCNVEESSSTDLSSTIERVLASGTSLAVELEEKKSTQEVRPNSGDVAYVFGGMPFRYLDGLEFENPTPIESLMDLDIELPGM